MTKLDFVGVVIGSSLLQNEGLKLVVGGDYGRELLQGPGRALST